MEHIATQEEISFNDEEVHKIVWQILESQLNEGDYNDERSNDWSNKICEDAVQQLTSLNKPFKYIVNCVLMQKNGAGLNSSTSCFWDTGNDGVVSIQWPKPNAKNISNPTVTAVVTVFAIKLS
mmetsp:Transcript_55926/g.89008  ORF Transcript_55926/g.89008 Transcript_55926/m.89008 type:complete len:123 (-) Transcript_55926:96-464(-)|eukprot:CAMPEP_0197020664 /NCGR_PEP_ID=MMETSP1384-20130603/1511_1 /TAXON_ID=29189 /ORGANISM="Ammonia sp." /LENGTH=122 /DNA_ID=CAMNT_0042448335 /DNA_START=34 /DNA_END=402 /DNA_ORIENTATION=+